MSFPVDQPLALFNSNFIPTREGHPSPGTVPEAILPAGVQKPRLFDEVSLPHAKALKLKNRVVVSPMCQYSAKDGFLSPYHLAHHGSWALHGVGTIVVEASAVCPQGRITPQDAGIWSDELAQAHASLITSLKSFTEGLTMGVQLNHAGRKASTWSPFHRGEKKKPGYVTKEEGGWPDNVEAPSPVPYDDKSPQPLDLSTEQIEAIIQQFIDSADRAYKAGYDFVEIHCSHGYFLSSMHSQLSNKRTDQYGGSFENRTRAVVNIVKEIKKRWPDKSLWVRANGTDFCEHLDEPSWTTEDIKKLASVLADTGVVDVLDISAGGNSPHQQINPRPGYQVPFAEAVSSLQIPKEKLLVGSVGMLEGPDYSGQLAEQVVKENKADLIFLARGLLANPKWVEDVGVELMGLRPAGNPQYHR